jgi:hypothetical protein
MDRRVFITTGLLAITGTFPFIRSLQWLEDKKKAGWNDALLNAAKVVAEEDVRKYRYSMSLYTGWGEEVTAPSYTKAKVWFDGSDFTYDSERGLVVSNRTIQFPAATESWGLVDVMSINDEKGEMLYTSRLAQSYEVRRGDTIQFMAGDITISNYDEEPKLGGMQDGGRYDSTRG